MKLIRVPLAVSMLPAATLTYNAALGTLPTSQGFTLTDTTLSAPAPTVSGGLLRQGHTPGSGEQFWYRSGLGADFATDYVELTARLRILSSSFFGPGPGSGFRTGFSIFVSDTIGNTFSLNLADGLAIVTREYDAVLGGTLTLPCDCAQTHDFRILAGGGISRVWIDGIFLGTVELLLNASSLSPYVDGVLFGDPTNFAGSQSQVEFVSVRTVPIPEPATAILVAPFGIAILIVRRRDRWASE